MSHGTRYRHSYNGIGLKPTSYTRPVSIQDFCKKVRSFFLLLPSPTFSLLFLSSPSSPSTLYLPSFPLHFPFLPHSYSPPPIQIAGWGALWAASGIYAMLLFHKLGSWKYRTRKCRTWKCGTKCQGGENAGHENARTPRNAANLLSWTHTVSNSCRATCTTAQ